MTDSAGLGSACRHQADSKSGSPGNPRFRSVLETPRWRSASPGGDSGRRGEESAGDRLDPASTQPLFATYRTVQFGSTLEHVKNPATALHSVIQEWVNTPGNSNIERRQLHGSVERVGLQRHVTAMALMGEVLDEIGKLERAGRQVDLYRRYEREWLRGILAMNKGWSAASSGASEFNEDDLAVLAQLADVLDHTGVENSPPLDSQAVATLETLLQEVLAAAAADTDLDDRLKLHIKRAARHLQTCIEEYDVLGASAAMEALDQVWVSMQAAAAQSSDPSRWRAFRDRFFIPTAAGLLANAPSLALQIGQTAG